ncbi:MAG: DUF4286 family protein [Gammaproteobacteria bacterium]|nr:DUF4286 family protein [Gammaproteobacteria bacterium]
MSSPTIIYEVNLDSDPAISAEFEAWLREHIRSMLGQKGFLSATLYSVESDQDGPRPRYTVHYLLESHAALEQSLGEHAAATHQAGVERFGQQFTLAHRVLTESEAADGLAASMYCRNCAAPIRGQYCAGCGQRSQVRVITLWELTRDMVGDIADLDSRIWRSLIPLLFRPGQLTVDYLRGRRARYMPPFRMYLVLSILFFLLVSVFNDSDNLFEINSSTDDSEAQLEIARDRLSELTAENLGNPEAAQQLQQARDALARTPDSQEQSDADSDLEDQKSAEQTCADMDIHMGGDLPWITEAEAEARVRELCLKVVGDKGKGLTRALLQNVPKMLFIFLPLIALVLKGLYPLSRRYYVEHLLFAIHFHAFVFLALILEMPMAELAKAVGFPTWPLTTILSLYIPYYLYKSMRRVYMQGRAATLYKYILLLFSYFFSLLMTFLATLAFTAFTL